MFNATRDGPDIITYILISLTTLSLAAINLNREVASNNVISIEKPEKDKKK